MIIHEQVELDYDDVLMLPNRSKSASRKTVNVERIYKFYHSPREWIGVPIFAANMANTGTFAMSLALAKNKFCTALHKFYKEDELIKHFSENQSLSNYIWYTTGIREKDIEKAINVIKTLSYQPNIVIDVPNGYTDDFVKTCRKFRELCPESIIMAGNVCTSNMVQELVLHGGIDIVKCGNSFGGACRTKNKTGIGRPMISTIIDCSHAANGLKSDEQRLGLICADGGCKSVGDICKALCAGANFVMLGSLFGACEENEGTWSYHADECTKKSLQFYGMSSYHAQQTHYDSIRDYATSEGEVLTLPYKGYAETVIKDILGGIRSCSSYLGIEEIKYLNNAANFIRLK